MTYDGETPDGTRWRIHTDNLDAEFAYLQTLAPGDRSKWLHVLELRQTPD